MTRPPWRPEDIGDAILHTSTRAPLPSVVPVRGPDTLDEVTFTLPGVDEVFVMMWPNDGDTTVQPVLWPMRLGYPREDH